MDDRTMLTLYYSPRACSMASHVALEEAGASFDASRVDIFAGANREPAYLKISPEGRVPALRFDDGRVLLESAAILNWVGTAYPDAGLLGNDPVEMARTTAMCVWLSTSVHPAFSQFVRPERFVDGDGPRTALRTRARERFGDFLRGMDAGLAERPWIMGDRFTVADPYALVFYAWGREAGVPIERLTHLGAMKDRLVGRPAARRALEREGSALLTI